MTKRSTFFDKGTLPNFFGIASPSLLAVNDEKLKKKKNCRKVYESYASNELIKKKDPLLTRKSGTRWLQKHDRNK